MGMRCLSRTGRCSWRFRKGIRMATCSGRDKRGRPVRPPQLLQNRCPAPGEQGWEAAVPSTSSKGRATVASGPLEVDLVLTHCAHSGRAAWIHSRPEPGEDIHSTTRGPSTRRGVDTDKHAAKTHFTKQHVPLHCAVNFNIDIFIER